jgi:hypothetical protein
VVEAAEVGVEHCRLALQRLNVLQRGVSE